MADDDGDRLFFWVACALGLLHAAPTLYWAAGGTRLVDTVGSWAADWQRESPTEVTLVLLGVFVLKVAGAVVPLVNELVALPLSRVWRGLAWAGSVLLVGYGGVNTVAAWAALAGWLGSAADMDRRALVGHAFLWDPLFAVWGLALGLALWRTRRTPE